ncbi:MAG: tRNA-uridine aminocarboxypropyltransferase [Burkholderiales bacterium]
MTLEAQKRLRCPACELPLRTCLCALVREVQHRIAGQVLQHPDEADQAKGTVRLLQRCLQNCDLTVGEHFQLPAEWLNGRTWLLYPSPQAEPAPAGAPARLLVLDATWRKSRKLLHLNPILASLPRYALRTQQASHYGELRRAQAAHQLSTLEAVAAALADLEGEPRIQHELLAALQDWLALQRQQRPTAIPSLC